MLCIKTDGFLMSDEMRKARSDADSRWHDDYLERQTYAVFCDFTGQRISAQRIPADSVLTESQGAEHAARLFFRMETGTHGEYYEYEGMPNIFAMAKYSVSDEKFDGTHISEVYSLEAPIKVLGAAQDGNKIYYLKYAVSEAGELEIQLVCVQDETEFVYEYYPLNRDTSSELKPVGFSKWRCAISPEGNICWSEPYSWDLKTYIDESAVIVPDSFLAGSVCWTDDNSMFYFKRSEKFQLYMYNAETGQSELFISPNRKTIELKSKQDVAMAIDNKNNILVVYSINDWDEFGHDKLHFFSLDTGEQYDMLIDQGVSDQEMENSLCRISPDDLGLNGYIYLESSYYTQSTKTKFYVQLSWLN